MQLINWKFVNFSEVVRLETYIFTIKDMLIKRHGRIAHLTICKESFSEKNEMNNEMRTLKEYGVTGGSKEDAPILKIYYDYCALTQKDSDPILLS